MARYHAQTAAPTAGAIVAETLEAVAREGARQMLQRALEVEVQWFLGRDRYAPGGRAPTKRWRSAAIAAGEGGVDLSGLVKSKPQRNLSRRETRKLTGRRSTRSSVPPASRVNRSGKAASSASLAVGKLACGRSIVERT